jgi:hypothetical protein
MRQTYEANLRQLRTLLDAQARLLSYTEEMAVETRAEIERVAVSLSPAQVDKFRKKDPIGLAQATARELADMVIQDVQRRLLQLNASQALGVSVEEMYERTAADLARLQDDREQWAIKTDVDKQHIRQLETRLAVLQQTLENAQQRLASTDVVPASSDAQATSTAEDSKQLPSWIQEWQRESTYEYDVALLRLLAESQVASRKDAVRLLALRLGKAPKSGSMSRVIRRAAAQLKLVELIEVSNEVSGGATCLLRLTEHGRLAYYLLFNKEPPAPCITTELLKRHKSPAHALLNLQAADMLREAGYEVDLLPGQIKLPGEPAGRMFVPDLVASWQGKTLFVEVERDTRKNPQARARKLRNYYDATGGAFYIVVPNATALKNIKSEINRWRDTERHLLLWMTSLSDAKGKKGEDIWLYKRGEPQ